MEKIPYSKLTKFLGDNFIIQKKSVVLRVPSAVIQGEYNFLINPNHKDFEKIKIVNSEPFKFDERLFKKLVPTRTPS